MPKRIVFLVAYLLCLQSSAFALVTSDEAGSHMTTPGQPAFGVNIDGVFGMAVGEADSRYQDLVPLCSGALIADRYALSAAHCLDSDDDGAVDPWFKVFRLVLTFESADGPVIMPFNPFDAQFPPAWPEWTADLAILTLPEDAPDSLPRYPLYGLTDEIGKRTVLAGYGLTGFGNGGVDETISNDGPVKRAGRNRYEAIREESLLVYDFDSGLPAHNALSAMGHESDLGFEADEVVSAEGDSGGPAFIQGAIAAVTAHGDRVPESDINHVLDSSWGELGLDTRVSSFRSFITDATGGEAVFLDLLGDFDFNEELDATDIDTLADHIRTGELNAFYDLDHSGTLDADDHRLWVKTIKQTWYGDADLDGEFNSSDLLVVVQAGEYEDDLPMNSEWETGDWNGDAEFGTGDLVLAFQDGGYERGPLSAAIAVPEPASLVMLVVGLAVITAYGCRC